VKAAIARITTAPELAPSLARAFPAWHRGGVAGRDAVARRLRSALVVDDDATLRAALASFLRAQGLRTITAATAGEAVAQLRTARPDLLVLDVRLPDGDAFSVLEHVRGLAPAPIRIGLSGAASPEEAFRLAQYGVRSFLQKPVSLGELWDAIQTAAEEPPDLAPFVQESVGHVPLRELTAQVREEAIKQALATARGNRSAAARILQVTRQAVQQMLRPSTKDRPGA
jgi:DNA-binding NtrC family response regulator